MTIRAFMLKAHLCMGLSAALFLVIIACTGAILALQPDYDRWLHPSLFRAASASVHLSEDFLAAKVAEVFAPGEPNPIGAIVIGPNGESQQFRLRTGLTIFVDPTDGTILGTRDPVPTEDRFLSGVRRLHVGMVAGRFGSWAVDLANLLVLLLLPTGVYLWWRKRITNVQWQASWRRITYDLHNVTGLYTCTFILVSATTGFFIAFEPVLHWVTGTRPTLASDVPHSRPPWQGSPPTRPSLDCVLARADSALPGERTSGIVLPAGHKSSIRVEKAASHGYGRSIVFLDQYSGEVLGVDDFEAASGAVRVHGINQAIHFGTVFGLPSRVLMAVSSLGLAILAITGSILSVRKVVV